LLPALLASAGPFLDRPHFRKEMHASRPWTAWAQGVLRHRNKAAVAGGAILIALIIPVFALNLGEPKSSALAQKGAAHAALASLQSGGIPSGVLEPMEVLVSDSQAHAVATRLAQVPGVYSAVVSTASDFHQGGTTIVEVLPSAEPSTSAGGATISAVRSTAAHLPGVIGVGGVGPGQVDFIHAVYGSFPLMLGLIGIATLLLLTRAFRSIVLAAKAVLFNMLSVAAAYGVMVLVWQQGHGSQALWSIPATGSITVWVPIMVFAFLFGLSMDYEVFILSRIREEYDRTGSTDGAVVVGIGRTGRLVTSAALILFLGFLSLSTAGMTDLKVMATGLGAGILLDALVVRSLLVPALVGVLGRWNWYLPAWLGKALFVREPAPMPVALPVNPEDSGERVLVGTPGDR
jgi:RND superfamily putative drug exporter